MSRLGRGLNSLIKDVEIQDDGANTMVKIEYIKPNRYQPRRHFDQEKLLELSESIKINGLIQPIVAIKHSDTDYEIIAGERRFEASKMAGLTEVPIYIKNVSDKEKLVLAIIENVQREDLSPIEEAKAYEQLINDFELTHLDLSKIMSKDRVTITNTLRLLKLSENIQAMIENKQITPGHARVVLSVDEKIQEQFAMEIIKKHYSVRKAEMEAQNYNIISQKSKSTNSTKVYDSLYLKSLEKELATTTGCAVDIKEKKDGLGEISIQFKGMDDLEKIRGSMRVADKLLNYLKTFEKP